MAKDVISELKVLMSNAGHYIGRTYSNEEETFGADFPYSRESGYFKTREQAEKALPAYKQMAGE